MAEPVSPFFAKNCSISHDSLEGSPKRTLLVNPLNSQEESLKSRNPRWGRKFSPKPSGDPNQIDSCGNPNVLEMGFRQADVTRTAQVEGSYPLRHRRFNPLSSSILRYEVRGLLGLACGL